MKHGKDVEIALRLLQAQLREWDAPLAPEQLSSLRQYAQLLSGYTQSNVIGTREIRSVVLNHILDSLSCLILWNAELRGALTLIDVGSGGGLPGIPLAIARPDLSVNLLEATRKKTDFLDYARGRLGLTNLAVLNERAEEAGRWGGIRDGFDAAVTRALASLPVVIEYCAPFVKDGGHLIAMKGPMQKDESDNGKRAAKALRLEFRTTIPVRFRPELEQKERQLVVFQKEAPTPTGYPRRVGLAKRRPLGG